MLAVRVLPPTTVTSRETERERERRVRAASCSHTAESEATLLILIINVRRGQKYPRRGGNVPGCKEFGFISWKKRKTEVDYGVK